MVSGTIKLSSKKTYEKHKLEHNARRLAHWAIKNNKIEPRPCEICGGKAEAHHDDYNKPLEVRWLCMNHHKEWHINNEPVRPSKFRKCKVCGKKFEFSNDHRTICSKECRQESIRVANRKALDKRLKLEKELRAETIKNRVNKCVMCGKIFWPSNGKINKYCGKDCRKMARLRQKREEYAKHKERYRENQARRMQDPVKRQRKREMDKLYRETHAEEIRKYMKEYHRNRRLKCEDTKNY